MKHWGKMKTIHQDITKMEVDAIVNAANSSLLGGGGVDGAIHQAAGPELVKACRDLFGCKVGHAKATPGFRLPAKWVIHAVGPIWEGGQKNEAEHLASCYRESLRRAVDLKARTVAFPAISTGIFGYPVAKAARVAIVETGHFLQAHESLTEVWFVCFSVDDLNSFETALQNYKNDILRRS